MKKWEEAEDKINAHLQNKYNQVADTAQERFKRSKESSLQFFVNTYNKILPIFDLIKSKN